LAQIDLEAIVVQWSTDNWPTLHII